MILSLPLELHLFYTHLDKDCRAINSEIVTSVSMYLLGNNKGELLIVFSEAQLPFFYKSFGRRFDTAA